MCCSGNTCIGGKNMSIAIFTLPYYKDIIHVSEESYIKGKAPSCKEGELEEFLPIWRKLTRGQFSGSNMKLKKRIHDEEYSMYPIVFITSKYWAGDKNTKPHGSTCIHIVQKQNQNLKHCKSFTNKYIDRETGVIILEQTVLHGDVTEPSYKFWFYEKDCRKKLPDEILKEDFIELDIMKIKSFPLQKKPAFFLSIEGFVDLPKSVLENKEMDEYENKYEKRYGYLMGEHIEKLVAEHTFPKVYNHSCKLIQWSNGWNFVIQDDYGSSMFYVSDEQVEEFLTKNKLLYRLS